MTSNEAITQIQWLKATDRAACTEILKGNENIDPEAIEGMVAGEVHITADLRAYVMEKIEEAECVGFADLPPIVLNAIDWNSMISNWLAAEDAVIFNLNSGEILVVWKYPVEEDELEEEDDLEDDLEDELEDE